MRFKVVSIDYLDVWSEAIDEFILKDDSCSQIMKLNLSS